MKKNLFATPCQLLPCAALTDVFGKPPVIALLTWDKIVAMISSDKLIEEVTLRSRAFLAAGDEKGYAHAKASAGAFIPAIQCQGGRRQQHITALTGVSMVDLDHVPDDRMAATLDRVRSDPHTFITYTTSSGHGIRILFRYTSRQPEMAYLDAWRWGNEYYAMLTSLPYDPATKDPTRLSFFCHDADCCYHPDAVPFDIISAQEAADTMRSITTVDGSSAAINTPPLSCAEVAKQIADRHIPFVEGRRHENLRYRAFLMNKMGCTEQEMATALEPDCPRGATEARSLASWVAECAKGDFATWKESTPARHDVKRRPLASQQRQETATDQSDAMPAKTAKAATPAEIRDFLIGHGLLRYNTLSATVEVWSEEDQAFVSINDRTVNSLWHTANLQLGKYVKPQDFDKELNSDAVPPFRPIEAYFESLPQWDKRDHIAVLASRIHTASDPQVFSICFRKWLVAMVASWLDPKVLNQNILTFIGDQGIFKSTFFRLLLPPELSRYFLAKGNSTYVNKDDKLAVSNYMLIDFEEIDSMKDADLNAVKALVTTEVIAERAAYAHNRENRPHLASFCATGNNRTFLTDLTGNRRWLPFEVKRIDDPYASPIDYPQLYAQAKALIDSGFQYWFTREQDQALEEHKSTFTEPCLEEEQLLRYYRKPEPDESGSFLTTTEIVARCSADLRGILSIKKMGQVLKRNGFRQHASNGKRGYILTERTFEEIQMSRIKSAVELKKGTKC